MNRGVITALATALLAVAACSTVEDGHGSVATTPASSAPTSSVASFPSSTAPVTRPGAVTSPHGEFSVVLPDGWRDGTDQMSGTVETGYFGPTHAGFTANVNVVREDVGGVSLSEFHRLTTQGLHVLKISGLSSPVPRRIDGEDALEYTFEDRQFGNALKQRQTLVLHDGRGYVITYSALRTTYEQAVADADAILDSWRWA